MVEAAVPRRSEGHSLRRCWSRLVVLASRRPAPFLTSRDGELWQLQLPTRRLLPQLLLPGLDEKTSQSMVTFADVLSWSSHFTDDARGTAHILVHILEYVEKSLADLGLSSN